MKHSLIRGYFSTRKYFPNFFFTVPLPLINKRKTFPHKNAFPRQHYPTLKHFPPQRSPIRNMSLHQDNNPPLPQ